jgi:hypothetical protein
MVRRPTGLCAHDYMWEINFHSYSSICILFSSGNHHSKFGIWVWKRVEEERGECSFFLLPLHEMIS